MPQNNTNINQLVAQCLDQDAHAERALYNIFASKVMTICRRYAPDESLAHDFFQEAWIKVFKKIGQFDAKKGVFAGWLYRITVNQCLMELRKNRNHKNVDFSQIQETDLEKITEKNATYVDAEVIIKAIQLLPPGYREVFNLYVIEEWKHDEIAQKLNIKADTSRSQLHRAKLKIRSFLNTIKTSRYEGSMVK